MGSLAFNKPEYGQGFPVEWIGTYSVPSSTLSSSLSTATSPKSKPLSLISHAFSNRAHLGLVIAYALIKLNDNFDIPFDGSYISSGVLLL